MVDLFFCFSSILTIEYIESLLLLFFVIKYLGNYSSFLTKQVWWIKYRIFTLYYCYTFINKVPKVSILARVFFKSSKTVE